jgi:hypothetical protein
MGHYSEALLEGSAFSPPVVGFDVGLDEATKGALIESAISLMRLASTKTLPGVSLSLTPSKI